MICTLAWFTLIRVSSCCFGINAHVGYIHRVLSKLCLCLYFLFSPCAVEHNEYVRTVMGNSNYLLLDETNIKQLLSVGNDSGYLLDVIKHIVSS